MRKIILSDRNSLITPKTIDAIMSLKLNPRIEYFFQLYDNIDGKLEDHIKLIESLRI
jgi:hypothetical protein